MANQHAPPAARPDCDPDARAALREVLDLLRSLGDVDYAEVRLVARTTEWQRARDGAFSDGGTDESLGVGVRVISHGQWGFAAAPGVDRGALAATARMARDVARASARAGGERVRLAPLEAVARGAYRTPVELDPFAVPLEDRIALLVQCTAALRHGAPAVRSSEASMNWTRLHKTLLTSDGTDVEQEFVYGGAGMACVAVGADGTSQRRSYPTFMDGATAQGGYEVVRDADLPGNVERVRDEALALLAAPAVPAGRTAVILESSQLALQIHESCGHPTELDRALGSEISLAGGSFLQPAMLGRFRYGAPGVNLVADATSPTGLGTFGWDDEGTAASRTDLVRDGLFVGYLSSRETAAALGVRSSGAMRASDHARAPLIRMVNVNLEPDPRGPTLEELIADTHDGIYIATNKSWSIDDVRLNFQFGCEAAWEVKRGRRTRLLRNSVYTGTTPTFWRSCDAICGPRDWRLWAVTNCGKGEPGQVLGVGHGAAPARFRDVEVGGG